MARATVRGGPLAEDNPPAPQDPYGSSKLEAEAALRNPAQVSGMKVTILRPPLVYGPGVRANFFAMMRWLHRGVPLPLGAIDNRRSLVTGSGAGHAGAAVARPTLLLGRASVAQRLCSSLGVDIGKARKLLGWTPPASVTDELARTARWFLDGCPET